MSKGYHTRIGADGGDKPRHSSSTGGSTFSQEDQDRLEAVLRSRAQGYLRLPNVTSVGVGERLRDGKPTGELAIQFTVSKKLPTSQLESAGLTPLPTSIETAEGIKIPVDVIERSYKPSYRVLDVDIDDAADDEQRSPEEEHDLRRRRADPMVPGISISHYAGSAGTLGTIVYDGQTGEPLILSNWHVLQGPGGRLGDPIVQPGPYDDSEIQKNVVGRLARSHLGIAGDCAVASIQGRAFEPEILGLNTITRRAAKPSIGDRVVKSGRTTGVTRGVVSRIGVVVNLDYGGNVGVQQIGGFEIRPTSDAPAVDGEISDGGDSGSAWLIDDAAGADRDVMVGLHFAGETDPDPTAEHALACNIHSVLSKLRVSLTDPTANAKGDQERLDALAAQVAILTRRLVSAPSSATASPCGCGGQCGGHAKAGTLASTPPHDVDPLAAALRPAVQEGLPIYGNWCGPMHGNGDPVDDLDRACMNHDRCYAQHGYFHCGCDDQLQREIDAALRSGSVRPVGRLLGPLIRRWFDAQPCRGASPVPQITPPLTTPGVRPSLRTGMAKTVTPFDCP